MPPSILSSNLITVPVLDTLIAQTAGHPSQQPKRVQLLSTKLAILTNRPSQPARGQPFDVELQIIQCRLELAEAYLQGSSPGALAARAGNASTNLKLAETELSLVERECKGVSKRYSRLVWKERAKSQRRQARHSREAEQREAEAGEGEGEGEGQDEDEVEGHATAGDEGSKGAGPVSTPMNASTSTPTSTSTSTSTSSDTNTTTTPSTPSTNPHSAFGPGPGPGQNIASPAPSDADPSAHAHPTGSPSSPPIDETKRQARLRIITENRIKALRMMAIVEDRSGRPERKARWEAQAIKLEAG